MTFSLYIPVLVNRRRACAARVTVVGLSECRCLFCHYRLRGGLLAIPAASELRELEKKGGFLETTAFERYAVKTIEKANMQNRISARSVYLGGSGSHNEWHVSTPACNLVL